MKLVYGTREFFLTRSSARAGAMPKRGVAIELVINGEPEKGIVTTNIAWCGDPSLALEYIWIPMADGKASYVTLGYGERAASWTAAEVSVVEGTGPKPVPRLVSGEYKSVTGECVREATRIDRFKDTILKKVG